MEQNQSNEISIPFWNYTCPVCTSKELTRTKGTAGDWVREYECNVCKSTFEMNEGDKMGGQFDTITIFKNTKQWNKTQPTMNNTVTDALDEAAKDYAEHKSSSPVFREAHIDDFKAGAKWQSQQSSPTPIKEVDFQGEFVAALKRAFYKGFDKCKNDDANCFTAWGEEAAELIEQSQQPKPKEVDEDELERLALENVPPQLMVHDVFTHPQIPFDANALPREYWKSGYKAALHSSRGFGIGDIADAFDAGSDWGSWLSHELSEISDMPLDKEQYLLSKQK